jgi:hypothetical protein
MKVPFKRTLTIQVPASATNADLVTILGKAPFDGTVSAASFTPNAAITGQNTNTRRVAIENRGAAGSGTTEMAAVQFNSGVNGVAFDEKSLTLSVVADALDVVAGDVLVVNSTSPGSGLADPGGLYVVEITRADD